MVTIDTIGAANGNRVEAGREGVWSGFWKRLAHAFHLWRRQRVTRARLADLSDAQLRDIGLTFEQAQREVNKSRFLGVDRPVQPPC